MAKQKVIAGVDFSGSTKDVPWITTAVLEGDSLKLKSCEPIRRGKLTKRLLDLCNDTDHADAVVAMDFPFGVPESFAKARLGLSEDQMPELSCTLMPTKWKAIASLADLPKYIKDIRPRLGKSDGVDGDLAKFGSHLRSWDDRHFGNKARPPLAKTPIEMFPMTFYGMNMLHEIWTKTKCRVPPLDCPDRTGPELLETMPGAALNTQCLQTTGYKTNKGINTLDNLKTRKQIVEKIPEIFRIKLSNIDDYRDLSIFNDDALDSIVAAVVAALWASDKEKTLFHRPDDHKDPAVLAAVKREGGIFAPKRIQQ